MKPEPGDKQLDCFNKAEVSSHKALDVFLGTPPLRMVIFAGIAIPEWDSHGNLDRKTVWVNFHYRAQHVFDYTAVAGLAAIGVDDDNPYAFGTDVVSVELREDIGELALRC